MNNHEYMKICEKKEEFEKLCKELYNIGDLVFYKDNIFIEDNTKIIMKISMSLDNGEQEESIVINNKNSLYEDIMEVLNKKVLSLDKQIQELK